MRFRTALGAKIARECRKDIRQTIKRQQQNELKYGTVKPEKVDLDISAVLAIGFLILCILCSVT